VIAAHSLFDILDGIAIGGAVGLWAGLILGACLGWWARSRRERRR
jgi:hypothetical protein